MNSMNAYVFTLATMASMLLSPAENCLAADLAVSVQSDDGQPAPFTVVYLETPVGGPVSGKTVNNAVMEQYQGQFTPLVMAVQKGTEVVFSNQDTTRHHVYSFSQAKVFETRLFGNDNPPGILFDRSGPVALGCNIHDWMAGHILVLDTGVFQVTGDDGQAAFTDLAPGKYVIHAWHPRVAADQQWSSPTELTTRQRTELVASLAPHQPVKRERELSPLKEKFRRTKTKYR